jgi:uncharacterized protein (DUF1015 family)
MHPFNFVRLILGEQRAGDNDVDNRFARSRSYLDGWLSSGILRRDPRPSFYVYEQRFERDGGRRRIRGLACAVKLHPYSDRVILPHENTLAKPKSHLVPLIHATKANLDSVYGLYDDEHGEIDRVLDAATSNEPAADVTDRDGVRHILWVYTDPAGIARISSILADKQIAIADGHHRYETALAYSLEMREKSGGSQELPSDYVLMTIANVRQKDMTVLPTHRVVGGVSNELMTGLRGSLAELFEIGPSSRETILADMAERSAIGMYEQSGTVTLRLRRDPASLLDGSDANRRLELNVLHKLVLERSLAIDDDKLRNETHIVYTRDAQEAMDLVDAGERQLAFLLNNISVKSVLDLAAAGEKMPQKATYFYPKLLSGLVLRTLD